MAQVFVASDDGATVVPIEAVEQPDGEEWTVGLCPCGEAITDRGHFEDTVEAVRVHLDMGH